MNIYILMIFFSFQNDLSYNQHYYCMHCIFCVPEATNDEGRIHLFPRTSTDHRNGDLGSFENSSFDLHDCDSGASTVPLTGSIRHGQHYFPLVNDPDPSLSPVRHSIPGMFQTCDQQDHLQQSPTSEVSTDMSILSSASTYCPEMSLPSTSAYRDSFARRKSSLNGDNKFNFNCPLSCNGSATMSSYCSNLQSPSPFLMSLVNGYPDTEFHRLTSFRLQPRVTTSVPDSPTSVSFTFQHPSHSDHYVSPATIRACGTNSSPLISPPRTPELNNANEQHDHDSGRLKEPLSSQSANVNMSHVNQNIIIDDCCYTPPESNKSTPENANSLTHDGYLRPRRSSSYDSVNRPEETNSGCYINMSPNKPQPDVLTVQTAGVGSHKFHISDLGRSEGSINRLGVPVAAPRESHRLSGVSDLSAMSGMTSLSTVDLDFIPSQSSC